MRQSLARAHDLARETSMEVPNHKVSVFGKPGKKEVVLIEGSKAEELLRDGWERLGSYKAGVEL